MVLTSYQTREHFSFDKVLRKKSEQWMKPTVDEALSKQKAAHKHFVLVTSSNPSAGSSQGRTVGSGALKFVSSDRGVEVRDLWRLCLSCSPLLERDPLMTSWEGQKQPWAIWRMGFSDIPHDSRSLLKLRMSMWESFKGTGRDLHRCSQHGLGW